MDFISIPGFEAYRISPETKEIQSSKQGKWKPLKIKYCGCYRLTDKTGEIYTAKPSRILYAALNNIDPRLIGKNLYVVEQGRNIMLVDRAEFADYMAERRPSKKAETIRQEYKQAIKLCNIILQAYETEDYTQVVSEIWKYENKLRAYMYARRIAINREKQNELWAQTFEVVLDAIREKRAYIVNMWGYLTRVLRTIHANMMRQKKLIISYDADTRAGVKRKII